MCLHFDLRKQYFFENENVPAKLQNIQSCTDKQSPNHISKYII